MSLTLNDGLLGELRKRIGEEIAERQEQIAAGHLDHDQYKNQCGQILGLKRAVAIAEQAHSDIQKR